MLSSEKISIILVDNQRIMCDGLRALFKSQPDMEVVGEARDSTEAVQISRELRPDVIVIDVNISGLNDISSVRHISQELPDVKIVALSMYPRKSFISELLRAGASGYVLKNHTFSELIKAIKVVMANDVYLCPKTISVVVGDYVRCRSGGSGSTGRGPFNDIDSSDELLTDRERKVLELIADGKSSKEIARIIEMSVKTVDARRRRIMQKLGIESIAGLVKYAIRLGMTNV
jgi:DNA-binding NarL/FixJ family response regulator